MDDVGKRRTQEEEEEGLVVDDKACAMRVCVCLQARGGQDTPTSSLACRIGCSRGGGGVRLMKRRRREVFEQSLLLLLLFPSALGPFCSFPSSSRKYT